MKTFLMTWNPDKDKITDITNLAAQFKAGNRVNSKWSVTFSKIPQPNDRFYLTRIRKSNSGIFASGVITSPPKALRHYDPAKAKLGKQLNFVDIEFDFIVDPVKQSFMGEDILHDLNTSLKTEQLWRPQSSGNEIKPEIVPYLDELWESFKRENTVITETAYIDVSKELDKRVDSLVRTEQQFLRQKLFNFSKLSTCCICNSLMPIDFLVAAHIKKRAECDEIEKRDYKNIVSPMCKLGCDELYEKGCIAVHDGQVTNLNKLKVGFGHESIQTYLKKVTGQRCEIYSPKNSAYFEWHYYKHK